MQAKDTFLGVARKIGQLQKECGLQIPVEDYVSQFHFGLVEVVFEWAHGVVCTVCLLQFNVLATSLMVSHIRTGD